ncbi:MAG: alpha/beta hydrolase [Rhizobium sp.]
MPVVLHHDSLGCVTLWRDFPALLAAELQRRVIAYDRLGFGQSSARHDRLDLNFLRDEAVHQLPFVLDNLMVDRFVACGHSVGGGMAVETGAFFAQRCEAIITIAAQAFVEDRTIEGIKVAEEAFSLPGALDRLTRYHGEKAEWVLKAWIGTWLSPAFESWSLEPTLARISRPVLAIHGDRDEYGSLAHPRIIANGRGICRVLPDVGHTPHRECPDLLVDEIAGWLKTLKGSDAAA